MRYSKIVAGICLSALGFGSCKTAELASLPKGFPRFYKEGHRGARGLMPENTVPSMLKAIEVGANVIEVDIFSSKDGELVVTHDAFINRNFSLLPDGSEIPASDAKKYIVHLMNYEEIRKFDVGLKFYQAFPKQAKISAHIPLLRELIDSVENYTSSQRLQPIIYNIELKTAVNFDGVYNAPPEEIVDAVLRVVKDKKIGSRFYIQSFDYRPLQYIHQNFPEVSVAFLTGSEQSLEKNLEELGFKPHIYSPHYNLVSAQLVQKCRDMNIKIVPWTVNTVEEMRKMEALGVDGIITDFPDYFQQLNKHN